MKKKSHNRFRKIKILVITIILTVACGVSVFAAGNAEDQKNMLNQRKPLISNQDLVIQIADIKEYITFYPVDTDGMRMEIMVVKAPDGTIRTAFNACHFCYQRNNDQKVTGYFTQAAGPVLFSLCGSERRYTMNQIQISSTACHPEPIPDENKIITSSTLTVSKEYLRKAKTMFTEMKLLGEKGSCCD